MYAAWHGWVIPMFLFLAILRLSLNYLISRSVQATPPLPCQPITERSVVIVIDVISCVTPPVPMMHCCQRLEDPVEHRPRGVGAHGESPSVRRHGVRGSDAAPPAGRVEQTAGY